MEDFTLKEFFVQIGELRQQDAADQEKIRKELIDTFDRSETAKKEMRIELMTLFNAAHTENRNSLQALTEKVDKISPILETRIQAHELKDDQRFSKAFWYIALGVGGLGAVSLGLAVLNYLEGK